MTRRVADQDVILAPYPAKSLNEERMQAAAQRRAAPARLRDGLHYVLHARPEEVQRALESGSAMIQARDRVGVVGARQVDAGPTGCMLIKRETFHRLMEAYPEMHCRITGSHAGRAQSRELKRR